MLESVVAGFPDLDLGIHVVWAPMLGSDDEESARKISKMFDDPRVEQYWDPDRRLGTSYSAKDHSERSNGCCRDPMGERLH